MLILIDLFFFRQPFFQVRERVRDVVFLQNDQLYAVAQKKYGKFHFQPLFVLLRFNNYRVGFFFAQGSIASGVVLDK